MVSYRANGGGGLIIKAASLEADELESRIVEKYSDVRELKAHITTELNVEGNPIESFCELVEEVRPAQVTLVPDAEDAITSSAGWDTIKHRDYLRLNTFLP